jgi:hypothetical protein
MLSGLTGPSWPAASIWSALKMTDGRGGLAGRHEVEALLRLAKRPILDPDEAEGAGGVRLGLLIGLVRRVSQLDPVAVECALVEGCLAVVRRIVRRKDPEVATDEAIALQHGPLFCFSPTYM